MKAIIILDNIDETEIAELRANVQLNLYGEDRGEYKNCPLKPMPVKKVPMFNPNDCDIEEEKQIVHEIYGYNVCIDEIYESDEE